MHRIVAFALSSNQICQNFIVEKLHILISHNKTESLKSKEKLCPVSLDIKLPPEVKQHFLCNEGSRSRFDVGG